MQHFAVIGNPIAHSLSPQIHHAFAKQFGIQLSYERYLSKHTTFRQDVKDFFTVRKGKGLNVTAPFKTDALAVADQLSEGAHIAQAVNTLWEEDGRIIGDNTDGDGLVNDTCHNHRVTFTDKHVLIIGAGGAARGVILPIARQSPASITIANRTEAKAITLQNTFAPYAPTYATSVGALHQPFDIVIHATTAELHGQPLSLPRRIFTRNTLAYDMTYDSTNSHFLHVARESGATTVNGLGMLVEQAARAFTLWHGVRPSTRTVIDNLQHEFKTSIYRV